jgi:hypothetical protein
MSVARMVLVVAPLRLTVWVLVAGAVVVVALIAIGVTRHLESVRADRHREHVRGELEPVFARFLETEDSDRLAEEFRPAFLPMDAAHRPVAAALAADTIQTASYSQQEKLRAAFEEAGIVERASGAPTRRSSLPSTQSAAPMVHASG